MNDFRFEFITRIVPESISFYSRAYNERISVFTVSAVLLIFCVLLLKVIVHRRQISVSLLYILMEIHRLTSRKW